jgi:hypothetical protein
MPGKHSIGSLQKKKNCTRDIACIKESATIWNFKPERMGVPLVQEKYQLKGNLW